MKTFVSVNPYTLEQIGAFEIDPARLVDLKINQLQEGYLQWRKYKVEERSQVLLNVAQFMQAELDEGALIISMEMGKPLAEAKAEIEKSIACLEFFAQNAQTFLQPQQIDFKIKNQIVAQPLGVIFGIFPWNYPVWQVIRFAAPTLMLGNTVLFKHAENCNLSAAWLNDKFTKAIEIDILKQAIIAISSVERIIANPVIKGITLTGSERAGRSVAAISGKYLKKVVLELGGSDPFIVKLDANTKEAAKVAVLSRFQNTGQSCIAAKRFIIHDDVYEQFKTYFLNESQVYLTANPIYETTKLGVLARPDLADKVESQVQQLIKDGARLVLGGKRIGNCAFEASMLENIPTQSSVYTEEIFGPVALLQKFKTDEEALKLANDTSFGLGCSVWTENPASANWFAENIEAGMIYINSIVRSTPELPFGGIKNSGFGKELSALGLYEFSNRKLIYNPF